MGFFDGYKDIGGGGKYITADQKQFLIENGVSFEITKLVMDPENQYGPRYVAFIVVPDEETGELVEAKLGFPVGSGADSRDAMLKAMEVYLDEDDEDKDKVYVQLSKPGRAILLQPAEAPAPAPKAKPKAPTKK